MAAVLVLLLAGLIFFYAFRGTPPGPPELTPEAKAYVRSLALSGVEMNAKENMMNAMLVEITGNIANNGNRTLRLVEINCVFYDAYGQVIHRERVPIVRPKGGSLAPGASRPFRLAFDSLPPGWNQAMPQLVIAHIDFEG
jgi:hypothetical protein